MSQFKEFQGKDLDECIKEACEYFSMPREKMEIEIIQDAKSGIFGIVGARKAKIRAKAIHMQEVAQNILRNDAQDSQDDASSRGSQPAQDSRQGHSHSHAQRHAPERPSQSHSHEKSFTPSPRPFQKKTMEGPRRHGEQDRYKGGYEKPWRKGPAKDYYEDERLDLDAFPSTPFEELDKAKLREAALETIAALVEPVAGRKVDISLDLSHGRVRAKVEWEGDAGLLIGREGQTLEALQYVSARILSKIMSAAVRVQLEIGDYKSRQDEKLREIAKALAEKARQTGRPWATRPLSSYHRRVIHMALQDEPGVVTRSAGDGPQKKVVIAPRREQY